MSPEPLSDAFAPTLADTDTLSDAPARGGERPRPTLSSTVLPRVEARGESVELVFDARRRYEADRVIGEGGMGEVELARDNDIGRAVALKRIRSEVGQHGLARFVEEVRTVGRLEHPNIVPIHDVGLDEQGRYFFVMKYVEGETIEQIIERLASGDPEAHRRYTFEARVNIFIGLLRALAHAHEQGVIHRDVKPANVMVGAHGEVVLMDWGVAKPVDGPDLPSSGAGAAADAIGGRLVQTAAGALVGTPHYMSPEQARGAPDIDARSDLYAACVLFHELMTLRHYLSDRPQNVPAILVGVMEETLPPVTHMSAYSHPAQGLPPFEYVHFVIRGMKKDPDARWRSAVEMMAELEAALEGRIRVQCPFTMTKRMAREAGRFVDRHPRMAAVTFLGTTGLVLFGLASAAMALVP